MNDHFAINLLISDKRLTNQLQKYLPKDFSAGDSDITLIAPWTAHVEREGFMIKGQLSINHQFKPGIVIQAKVGLMLFATLMEFPEVAVAVEWVDFIETPKVKLLGCFKIPVKRIAERQLKLRMPQIKAQLNEQLANQIKQVWPRLQEKGSIEMPTGWQLHLKGMQWKLEKNDPFGHLDLRPQLFLNKNDGSSAINFENPFINDPKAIDLSVVMTIAEINTLLEKNNNHQQIKTPAGTFTLERITATIVDEQLSFLVDFVEEKNGQLNLIGEVQIIEAGKGIAFEVAQVEWHSVNILKQGLLSLFQQKVKSQINQALQFEQSKIQKLLQTQLKALNEQIGEDMPAELKSYKVEPNFEKVELLENGLQISATLSGQISLELE